MSDNSVLKLRLERLARATKPFRARGSRVIRCNNCLLNQKFCICHTYTATTAKSAFCLLMYDTEPMKPSNTGRLIADILPTTYAFQWSRTAINPELLELLADEQYQPYVIFPASHCRYERVVTSPTHLAGKTPLFIILDGTWPEAGKMFRKSPYLNAFPVLSLTPQTRSNYTLRESPNRQQLCTAEVAVELLKLANDYRAAAQLSAHFNRFRQYYLAGKANRAAKSGKLDG